MQIYEKIKCFYKKYKQTLLIACLSITIIFLLILIILLYTKKEELNVKEEKEIAMEIKDIDENIEQENLYYLVDIKG